MGQRVIRGGSWYDAPVHLPSSNRHMLFADYRGSNIGFRLAQDIE